MGLDPDADRGYRLLLRLYPREFRARFGDDMTELFRDRRRRARGAPARLALWAAAAADVLWQAVAVRCEARAARRAEGPRAGPAAWGRGLGADARDAWRALVGRPGLSLVAIFTLGLGLGVGISMFGLVHAVLLAPLPFDDPDRVVVLNARDDRTGAGDLASPAEVRAWRDEASSFEALAGYAYRPVVVTPGDHEALVRAQAAVVTAGYFDVLPVIPLHGRLLGSADEPAGAEPAAVVGHRFWLERFSGDPAVVGRRVRIDRSPTTIVGVLPAGFADISDVTGWNRPVDLWIPARAETPAADVGVGFPTRGVALVRLDLSLLAELAPEARAREARALREEAARLPGARDTALWGPGLPGNSVDTIRLFADAGTTGVSATTHHVSAGGLGALGIPIARGRDIEPADREGAAPVAIVSETIAKELWPGQEPVGRALSLEPGGAPVTVVGVAGDVNHHRRFDGQARLADVYLPIDQRPVASPYLLARPARGTRRHWRACCEEWWRVAWRSCRHPRPRRSARSSTA